MNEQTINETYHNIIRLLDNKQLKDAFMLIEQMAFGLADSVVHNTLEESQTTYKYLLQYMKMGMADPERNRMYGQLICTAYQTADRVRTAQLTTTSDLYYFDRLRYYRNPPLRLMPQLQLELETYTEEEAIGQLMGNKHAQAGQQKLSLRKRYDQACEDLFYRTWLAPFWSETNRQEAQNLLQSVLVPANALAIFASAITLSLIQYFDERKMHVLIDAYQHENQEVKQRALVGLVIAIFLYDSRVQHYPELKARIALLCEEASFVNDINRIQIQLLLSRETQKADRKMREEIIPRFMKAIRETKKMDLEDLDEEAMHEDFNPEWEDWLRKAGIEDKMKELSEMQQEGVDMYLNTFSQLKSFPFFRQMSNWFYPFDMKHTALQEAGIKASDTNAIQQSLLYTGLFCNSDKYSFAFMLSGLPAMQQEGLIRQMFAQAEEINQEEVIKKIKENEARPGTICNKYIQDLYRFFKLFPHRKGFHDIFAESLLIHSSQTLHSAFENPAHLRTLADYLFRKGYMDESLRIYRNLIDLGGESAEIFQRIGYCQQQLKAYDKAIEAYRKADLMQPNQLWTLRHLATCHRLTQQYDQALSYYLRVEETEPDNLNILLQIGFCLIQLKEYEKALPYFFKVDYLNSTSVKAQRAIAWCSFLCKKYDQALKYYDKITAEEPKTEDMLNRGHVTWVCGKTEEAVLHYTKALKLSADVKAFISTFNQDCELLVQAGIPIEDIPLMQDLIRYEAEKP